MLGRSFTLKELQLNQLKPKPLPWQYNFATFSHDKQIKPVHYLVKRENVLFSQKAIVILFYMSSEVINSPFVLMIR